MSLCLYAIMTATAPLPRLRGACGETLTLVRVQGVGGVVGAQRSPMKGTPRNLRAYHGVVSGLAQHVSALLPVRFGTEVDEEELTFILASRRRFLIRALAAVRGRTQMSVRIVRPQTATRAARDGADTEVHRLHPEPDRSSGAAYLKSRADAYHRAAQYPECVALRRRAKRWIRAERVEERGGIVSLYHLVPRSAADSYRRAIENVADQLEMRAHVSGPFPPFAFAGMGDTPGPLRAARPAPRRGGGRG